jgi:outer membrane receptor protein involved in Fe transport
MNNYKALPLATMIAATVSASALAETFTLEEIVVTAQKREQNLQDVPVAVQAVSGDQIADAGITNFTQIQQVAPGVVINDTQGQVLPYVRGVGSSNNGNGVYSNVAIYVDGVYNSRITGGSFELANIESVQVLKGPQGALYGRNATGGALVVTTKTPEVGGELSGAISATIGSDQHRALSLYVESGLGDTTAGSFSALKRDRDGYLKNLTPGQDDLKDKDALSMAGKFVFESTDEIQLVLGASYNTAEDSSSVANFQLNTQPLADPMFGGLSGAQVFIMGLLAGAGLPPATAAATAADATYPSYGNVYGFQGPNAFANGVLDGDNDSSGNFVYTKESKVYLKATLAMETFDIVSVTAVAESDYEISAGAHSGEAPGSAGIPGLLEGTAFGFAANYETDTFTQELQLISTDSELEWIAGAYYFVEDGDTQIAVDAYSNSQQAADNYFEVESWSVFGQVKYPVTDALGVTVGARYTSEEMIIDDHMSGLDYDTDSSQATGTLILDYQFDHSMVYGSISSGFKSGALNTSAPFTNAVDPEELLSYELGYKSDLADGRVRLNGSVFVYDYSNVHMTVFDTSIGGGVATIVDGTEASVVGAEVELKALLAEHLTLDVSATALETEYKDDVFTPRGDFGLATEGNNLVGAPDLAANIALEYAIPLDNAELSIKPLVSYNSGVYYSPANTVGSGGLDDADFTLVNLSVNYRHDNGWKLSLFANNLTDEEYYSAGVDLNGFSYIGNAGDPLSYGLTLGYEF